MTLIKVIIAWAIVAAVLIGGPAFAGCHHLFRQNVVQHHAHAVAVVQPLYFAGQSIQDEALLRKAIRAEAPAILREALQQLQAPAQQPIVTGAISKCAKCHKGDTALTSDPATFKSFARMAGLGEGVPAEMKAVIAGLTPAEKGEITEYLLRLPAKPDESGVLSLRTKPDLQRFPLPPTTNVQPPEPME